MSTPAGPVILNVDDNEAGRYATTKILRNAGFRVTEAVDGAAALRLAEDADLVVLDVNLPDMSGFEVCRCLRSNPATSATPVLHLSATYVDGRSTEQGLAGGADAYLTHPVEPRVLVAYIRALLRARETEKALRESEEQLRSVVETANDAIICLDGRGLICLWNDAASTMFGHTAEEAVGQPVTLVIPESLRQAHQSAWGRLIESRAQGPSKKMQELVGLRRDGTEFPAELSLGIWEGVQGTHCAGIVRDITQRKRREELLIRSERLRAMGELAAGVAHHFNNLLQVLMGNMELALLDLERGDFAEVELSLKQAFERSHQGADLVKRLQAAANMGPDATGAGSGIVDLSRVTGQAAEVARPLYEVLPGKEGRHVAFNLHLTDGCFVKGRDTELFEVALNLIKNATEALRGDGEIDVGVYVEGDHVLLRVSDSGVGIRKEHIGRVFEPFWCAEGLMKPGLGLAISHRIVSRYGGSVSVESEPGKGSTFTVQFPLCDQPQKAAEIASKAPRPAEKFTVLLIDDMGPVVAVCKAALERFGHKALTADSGAAALEIFKETPIDVALCDLGLPEMNGWEVGKRIVEICRDRDVAKPPFILFTGWGGQVLDKAKIVESGVDGVIAKPIEISKLIKVISELGASRKGEKGR